MTESTMMVPISYLSIISDTSSNAYSTSSKFVGLATTNLSFNNAGVTFTVLQIASNRGSSNDPSVSIYNTSRPYLGPIDNAASSRHFCVLPNIVDSIKHLKHCLETNDFIKEETFLSMNGITAIAVSV